MRLVLITCVVWCTAAAAAGSGRLLAKLARHHKRGVVGGVPTFKLGHDIPRVTHSVIKPFVVTYPPSATVSAVKVPLAHPLVPRPPPRLPLPPQHFHHHHHHVPAARPVVPVVPPPPPPPPHPLVPSPSVAVPSPPLLLPARPVPPPPAPVLPPPHISPLLPAAAIPLQPAPVLPAPVAAYTPQIQYVLRPGNAVQTSVFATYPRYPVPFASYRPALPLGHVASYAPNLIFGQPALTTLPPTAVFPQALPVPATAVPHAPQQPPPPLALQPAPVEHDGWAPLPSHHHDMHLNGPHLHFVQGAQLAHETQSQTQFEHESQEHGQFAHDLQAHAQFSSDAQAHAQYAHDIQAQAQYAHDAQAHAQYEHDARAHAQFAQDAQAHDARAHAQFAQDAQAQAQFAHEANVHAFSQEQYANSYNTDAGTDDERYHELQQHVQHQLEQLEGHRQYGAPPVEGRSGDAPPDLPAAGDEQLRYHNHIPLGLQPPLDRPLEHFR